MNHIWSFLLQTCAVSITAIIILILKKLLEDKLSPRWQYGVWIILMLRIIVPVQVDGFSLLPLGLWIETLKSKVEALLSSSYIQVFEPISTKHILPVIKQLPSSITDILWCIYVVGILVFLAGYLISYIRLKRILENADIVSDEINVQIQTIAKQHKLGNLHVIQVDEIQSAFVYGIINPVLVLPSSKSLDEKVLLHEFMHIKYHDTLQNIIWIILRCLHWCNPFIWYVMDHIGNDMESLCDQRVLERLEGEDRREYGKALLAMANEKYSRTAGTSSISNGGKNITKRINAIIRFKKYPKGMSLVSVCISLVLGSALLPSKGYAYKTDLFQPVEVSELPQSMAMTRINRSATLAGALDTYAKGLLLENGIYLASASSLDKQEVLYDEMIKNAKEENWVAYHIDAGKYLDYIDKTNGYEITNLRETEKGIEGVYLFEVSSFLNDDGIGWKTDDEGNVISGCVMVPFIAYENHGWIVEEIQERKVLPSTNMHDLYYDLYVENPYKEVYEVQGRTGSIEVGFKVNYKVNNSVQSNSWFGGSYFDTQPKLNAQFDSVHYQIYANYDLSTNSTGKLPEHTVGFMIGPIKTDGTVDWPEINMNTPSSGGSNDNISWSIRNIDDLYQNRIHDASGSVIYDVGNELIELHRNYKVRIYWDGEMVEELTIIGEEYE